MKKYRPALTRKETAEERRLADHPNSLFSEEDPQGFVQKAIHSLEKIHARFAGDASPTEARLYLQLSDLMQEIESESLHSFTLD